MYPPIYPFTGFPTQNIEISTVIHNLSPTGAPITVDKKEISAHPQRLLFNSVGELGDLVIDRSALSHQLTDFAIGVHNRCVVAPAECLADFWK